MHPTTVGSPRTGLVFGENTVGDDRVAAIVQHSAGVSGVPGESAAGHGGAAVAVAHPARAAYRQGHVARKGAVAYDGIAAVVVTHSATAAHIPDGLVAREDATRYSRGTLDVMHSAGIVLDFPFLTDTPADRKAIQDGRGGAARAPHHGVAVLFNDVLKGWRCSLSQPATSH